MNEPLALSDCPDESWDGFLRAHAEGQFQQSAAWARVKALEGWSAERRVCHLDGGVAGGFQLLWKPSRLGRIGYVSKGPVVPHGSAALRNALVRSLIGLSRELRLRALVAQPPDVDGPGRDDLVAAGFYPHAVPAIIAATAVVPLQDGPEAVEAAMSPNARRERRTALKRGVSFRWGERSDLGAFFALMCVSARRQHGAPNPASLRLLEALWDALSPHVSLAIAEHLGTMNAAALLVRFGSRLTVWKVGWSGERPDLFGNCFVNTEALLWGARQGCALGDFVAIDPAIARTILEGRDLSEEQNRSKDKFHLKLGARPVLLPPALLHVSSPLLRPLLRAALRLRPARRVLMSRIHA